MKRKQALFAAAFITVILALGLVAVGVNAAMNPNGVPVSNSPAAATTADPTNQAQAQIKQLESLIAQYQAREKQYQQQLNQEATQVQQLQSILTQLQNAGVITIQSNGTISLGRGRRGGFDDFGGGNGGNTTNPSGGGSF